MQLLKRNEAELEYLPYTGLSDDQIVYESDDPNDEPEAVHTGEFHRTYGDPVQIRGSISAPSGRLNETFYGQNIRYTHTLVIGKSDTDIKESGLIRYKGELYDIQAVRPTLNATSIALRKQTTDGETP